MLKDSKKLGEKYRIKSARKEIIEIVGDVAPNIKGSSQQPSSTPLSLYWKTIKISQQTTIKTYANLLFKIIIRKSIIANSIPSFVS